MALWQRTVSLRKTNVLFTFPHPYHYLYDHNGVFASLTSFTINDCNEGSTIYCFFYRNVSYVINSLWKAAILNFEYANNVLNYILSLATIWSGTHYAVSSLANQTEPSSDWSESARIRVRFIRPAWQDECRRKCECQRRTGVLAIFWGAGWLFQVPLVQEVKVPLCILVRNVQSQSLQLCCVQRLP